MMQKVNVTPIVLRGYGGDNQVTLDTLKSVRNKYRWIRYMHIDSHGDYEVDGPGWFGFDVPRSVFLFNDGPWVAFNSRLWTDYNQPIPSWYNNLRLSNAMERAPCFWLLLFPPDQLKIVVSEACHSLRNIMNNPQERYIDEGADYGYQWEVRNGWNYNPTYFYSDICRGLMLQTSNQVVLGSGEVVTTDTTIYPYWQYFFNTFWNSLGEGKAVPDALIDAREIAYSVVQRNYRVRAPGLTNSNLKLVKDR